MLKHGMMWLAAAAVFMTAACSGTATTAPLVTADRSVSGNSMVMAPVGPAVDGAEAPSSSKARAQRSGYLVASGRAQER